VCLSAQGDFITNYENHSQKRIWHVEKADYLCMYNVNGGTKNEEDSRSSYRAYQHSIYRG
jgi:hypothetical protein